MIEAKKTGACLLCGATLVYESAAKQMECAVCHKVVESNAKCENGHFICDDCHRAPALSVIRHIGLNTELKNPVAIAKWMMRHPAVHMHGPEHHVLGGAALLAAYRNSGGDLELKDALLELEKRGGAIPGGTCGFWGCCGAALSAGIFLSIVTQSSPMSQESWGACNRMTAECLGQIGALGGPRCCKRTTYFSVMTAAHAAKEITGIAMELPSKIVCEDSSRNRECFKQRCPFFPRVRLKRV